MVLNTAASVPDDVVYQVTKAIHESQRELSRTFAPFKPVRARRQMAKPLAGVPMHPGAVRFYRESRARR